MAHRVEGVTRVLAGRLANVCVAFQTFFTGDLITFFVELGERPRRTLVLHALGFGEVLAVGVFLAIFDVVAASVYAFGLA